MDYKCNLDNAALGFTTETLPTRERIEQASYNGKVFSQTIHCPGDTVFQIDRPDDGVLIYTVALADFGVCRAETEIIKDAKGLKQHNIIKQTVDYAAGGRSQLNYMHTKDRQYLLQYELQESHKQKKNIFYPNQGSMVSWHFSRNKKSIDTTFDGTYYTVDLPNGSSHTIRHDMHTDETVIRYNARDASNMIELRLAADGSVKRNAADIFVPVITNYEGNRDQSQKQNAAVRQTEIGLVRLGLN